MLSLRMLSHGFKIITLDTLSWKYNNLRTNVSLSLSFNLPLVLEYDSMRYFHAVTFECSSILSHEHTLRSKVHCDLVLVLSLPQFWRSVPDRDTDPPLALSLTTLHTSYCKILHKKFFYNFAHILLQTLHKKLFSQLWTHLITKFCTRYCLQLCAHVIAKYCTRNFAHNGNFSLQNKFSNLS